MRIILFFACVLIASLGGVLIYRAAFLDPSTAVVVTETHVRELPSITRIAGGAVLLVLGGFGAFFAIAKKR